ncbi:MAG TPA: DUF4097 family beta strand repeat-containing protein [Terriglobales bacterium]|jgi:hypothetical protein|nr:DUF4097 family beta strand repeat-containing protein [Terriglobales bacterium]
MRLSLPGTVFALTATLTLQAWAADTHKESRMQIAPGGTLNLVSNAGSVNLKPGPGNMVVVAYHTHSDQVEVDLSSTADHRRIEVQTHVLSDKRPAGDEANVEYEVIVPAGTAVNVNTVNAPITVDGLSGDLNLSSESGTVTVRNVNRSHLTVRGVSAPVNLADISAARLDVTANGGAVQMTNVWGPKVKVGTSSGNISYRGDCSGVGSYDFSTHSGNIDLLLPEKASVDLTARSYNGTVENDFPLQKKPHSSFQPKTGSSFAGTSNSGASSVTLQSINGKIRVTKQ